MTNEHLLQDRPKRRGGTPLSIAIAIAPAGVFGLLIVDHSPWNKPRIHTAAMAHYSTTREAARAVGAVVAPTEPQPQPEPDPPGPKPVDPATPAKP